MEVASQRYSFQMQRIILLDLFLSHIFVICLFPSSHKSVLPSLYRTFFSFLLIFQIVLSECDIASRSYSFNLLFGLFRLSPFISAGFSEKRSRSQRSPAPSCTILLTYYSHTIWARSVPSADRAHESFNPPSVRYMAHSICVADFDIKVHTFMHIFSQLSLLKSKSSLEGSLCCLRVRLCHSSTSWISEVICMKLLWDISPFRVRTS